MPTGLPVNHDWWNKRGDAMAACLDLEARLRKIEAAAAKAIPPAPVEPHRRAEYVTLLVQHSSSVPALKWEWQAIADEDEIVTVVQPIALANSLAVYTDKCERLEAENEKLRQEAQAELATVREDARADHNIAKAALDEKDKVVAENEQLRALARLKTVPPKPRVYMPRFDSHSCALDYIAAVREAIEEAGAEWTYEPKPPKEQGNVTV